MRITCFKNFVQNRPNLGLKNEYFFTKIYSKFYREAENAYLFHFSIVRVKDRSIKFFQLEL